ncbi:MAG: hypothetical protein FJW26_01535, partial [Acidimicrobiia bacterium]|nr:hypothetical protein [Acidimicrobiia bacterium]
MSHQVLLCFPGLKSVARSCPAIGFWAGRFFLGLLILTGIGPEHARSAQRTLPDSQFYSTQIHPMLVEHCQGCHNGEVKKGGLDLSSREGLLKGGDSGPSIVRGNAEASLLYKLVAHEQEPAMPYKLDKLPAVLIAQLATWIDGGAPFDTAEPIGPTTTAAGLGTGKVQAGGTGGKQGGERLFGEKVRPVLENLCLNCHGGKFKQAGLSLVSRETLLQGSDNGAVVVAGDAANSLLVKKIRHEHEPGMPYKGPKLGEEVIEQVVAWINAGAPYDGTLTVPVEVTQGVTLRHGSDHWAYQKPKRGAVPVVKNG